jgi:transposase-like protein
MTDIESEVGSILKRDRRGRVRSTPEQRQAVLEQYGRSGLSGPEFARVAGIAYQTFACWRHQRRKAALALRCRGVDSREEGGGSVRLVEAVMGSPEFAAGSVVRPVASVAVLHLELPGGTTLRVSEAAQVPLTARLLQALAEPC